MPQQKPVVKCSICGYLCEGREAGRHRELTKHNCWELIMNQKNDFQASEYTSRRGIPQNNGIEQSELCDWSNKATN